MTDLLVGRKKHTLNIKIATDKETYAPREKVRAKVQIEFPANEKTLPGSFSFVAVDESLITMAENHSWNLLSGLIRSRNHNVQTFTNLQQLVGKRHFGQKATPVGGDGGGILSRQLFDPLAAWFPRLETDSKGLKNVEFTLNDSLTKFRVVVIASAGVDFFGTGFTTIISTKDILTYAGISPVGRENEHQVAEISVKNTVAAEKNLKVRFSGDEKSAKPIHLYSFA